MLITNSNYFPKQHYWVGVCNEDDAYFTVRQKLYLFTVRQKLYLFTVRQKLYLFTVRQKLYLFTVRQKLQLSLTQQTGVKQGLYVMSIIH